ncbi:MAG TPA: hypothetical protein PK455_06800 [Caldisericia bacterium]|nr:hypothetical protein [Caldisericia bacterium]
MFSCFCVYAHRRRKESKHWIPNQVGDDSSIVIPAKAGIHD